MMEKREMIGVGRESCQIGMQTSFTPEKGEQIGFKSQTGLSLRLCYSLRLQCRFKNVSPRLMGFLDLNSFIREFHIIPDLANTSSCLCML